MKYLYLSMSRNTIFTKVLKFTLNTKVQVLNLNVCYKLQTNLQK